MLIYQLYLTKYQAVQANKKKKGKQPEVF